MKRSTSGPAQVDGLGLRLLRTGLELYQRLIEWAAPGPALWDVDRFGGLRDLEAGWAVIRDEYDRLEQARARHDFEDVAGMPLGVVGSWQAHFLVDQGTALPAADRCPATCALLERVHGLRGAYFSVMGPATSLLPHAGPNPTILRGHLTVRTPEPVGAAGLEVDGERVAHEPGVIFVFDDTRTHRAWNEGDSDRATLMLDLRRPIPTWLRPIDAVMQALWRLHPARRSGIRRLVGLDAAKNG